MANIDSVKQAAKDLALLQHQNDSDETLRQIMRRGLDQMLANNGLTDADMIHKARLAGEAEACAQIIKGRQKTDAEQAKKNLEWKNRQAERKAKAILNLPYGASPNGQLVAAILEEVPDGLTARQIAGWYDELTALPDDEFQALLDGLAKEEIIECDEAGQYRLLSMLDSDMNISPKAGKKKLQGELDGVLEIYALMHMFDGPVSYLELARLLGAEDNNTTIAGIILAFLQLAEHKLAIPAYEVPMYNSTRELRVYYALQLLGEEAED